MGLTDANQDLAAYYEYDAWGNTMTEAEVSGVDNPYRYSTKEWDEKSGLCYFGARYYSPEIGRWTQRDPLGEVDGLNLYRYVGNEPVASLDAWGLEGIEPSWWWYFWHPKDPSWKTPTPPSPVYLELIGEPDQAFAARRQEDFEWASHVAKRFQDKCFCIAGQLTILHFVRGTPQGDAAFEQAKKCIKWNRLKVLDPWDVKETSTTVSQMVGWAYTNDPAETKIVVYHEVYKYGKLIHRDIKSIVCGCVRYVFDKPPKH